MQNPIRQFAPLLLFICCVLSGVAQTLSFESEPYFSAVVVKNIEISTTWYKSVLGLTIKEKMIDPNGAYRITILESPKYLLELLELKGSVPRDEALKGKTGMEMQGHFKIGFRVADMDACLKHLATQKVIIPEVWTDAKTKKRNFLIKDPDGNLVQFFE